MIEGENHSSTKNMNNSSPQSFTRNIQPYTSSTNWTPPTQHGLQNSRPIIQSNYVEQLLRGNYIDYTEIIKDDLRNMRPLTIIQLDYVKKLDKKDLLDIIEIFNQITTDLIEYTEKIR